VVLLTCFEIISQVAGNVYFRQQHIHVAVLIEDSAFINHPATTALTLKLILYLFFNIDTYENVFI